MSMETKSMQEDAEESVNLSSGIAAFESKQFTRALQLLTPLAQSGDPDAQYRLAIMYQNGLGLVRNDPLAFRWVRASAEQGHALAQHGLGFMYMEGECTERCGEKAVEWFQRAAAQGLTGSRTTLAMMYEEGRGIDKDPDEARKWYKLAGFPYK